MPDTAHARLALRRLVAGLITSRYAPISPGGENDTIDELLSRLDSDEGADLRAVFDFIDDTAHERPRFVMVAKERDYYTGAARGMFVVDLVNVDAHNCEAELMAMCPGEPAARSLTLTLNEHGPTPPAPPPYDAEPF